MSVFDTLRIAASGLTAQRLRMDVAASNLANVDTTATPEGGPYRPESVLFSTFQMGADAAGRGVMATAILTPDATVKRVYEPRNPVADADGYVIYPDVDMAAQLADLLGASRSFGVASTVAQAAKQTALDSIELGRRQ
jgi:flagellar basal-body rod protein FlgC